MAMPEYDGRERDADGTVLCSCGCKEPAPLAKKTSARDGHVKNEPLRFLPGHHWRTSEFRERARERGRLAQGSVEARLKAKLAEADANGCKEFLGTRTLGYGMLYDENGRSVPAHRVAYRLAFGEAALRGDRTLHHACFNRACCSVDHLVVMSRSAHTSLHMRLRKEAQEAVAA